MKRKKYTAAMLGLLASTTLLLTGCGANTDTNTGGKTTLTLWHNSTTGEGKEYWEKTAIDFEKDNPGTVVKIQPIQNEDMDGKLQTALNSGDAPDIFMARGGGKLADIVEADQVLDITDSLDPSLEGAIGQGVLSAFEVDGKLYGMPIAVLPGGIFYNKDIFTEAGIETPPTTVSELESDSSAIKELGTSAIALGAKDAWPAAHWYYFFALRNCSQDTINATAKAKNFNDSCWLKAGKDLEAFMQSEPFNDGALTTSAQQGAGSSAGLVANNKAAMELMGAWNPGVIASLTPDQKPLASLSWFAFPEVTGGKGEPGAMMGGVDGYSCSAQAPKKECTAFLNFIAQKQQQENYASAFHTLPANKEAQQAVTDPSLQSILAAYNDAPYVMVWLDTLYGQGVGNALNSAVVDLLAQKGTPEDIVKAVNNAWTRG
ncbi:extracellular solute-binding protein [Lysinibacter sp. HNR]|uniref:extracellular solute-binding protein n=1 Tax=Lysinibacter sp. HNR TaxID=3031408 RepID=UPI002435EE59|nr:extracellular solute-binding protein [Lysinibacter sp. HNR]WGD37715.1 extracellular solute-binding protein [Lysinibacter sp. HNR]